MLYSIISLPKKYVLTKITCGVRSPRAIVPSHLALNLPVQTIGHCRDSRRALFARGDVAGFSEFAPLRSSGDGAVQRLILQMGDATYYRSEFFRRYDINSALCLLSATDDQVGDLLQFGGEAFDGGHALDIPVGSLGSSLRPSLHLSPRVGDSGRTSAKPLTAVPVPRETQRALQIFFR